MTIENFSAVISLMITQNEDLNPATSSDDYQVLFLGSHDPDYYSTVFHLGRGVYDC